MMHYHFNGFPIELVSTFLCTYYRTEGFTSGEMKSAIFQSTQKASFLGLGPHFITDDINSQFNCAVYVAIGGHCYATLLKIHIHLNAFDRQVYRKIELIAATLMTFSKARAPELKMISGDFYRNDKPPF